MNDAFADCEPLPLETGEEFAMTEYVGPTGRVLPGDNPLPPAVGMEFESYEDVYFFYNCYARQQGFGVRVSNTWYRKGKERYRAKLSCSSAGFKKQTRAHRRRPETRTGCPAMIKFKLMEDSGRWRIIETELDHNHLTSPVGASLCKSHRVAGAGNKRPLTEDGVEKIRLLRTVVVDEVDDGVSNFNESGIRAKLSLEKGDIEEMVDFFTKMQLQDPNFFYVMDVNGRGCLRNVFWAEGRCRAAYGHFGEVVYICAKPLVERYKIPLVLFMGVNHHEQTLPLGCGLVSGQNVKSFMWLLRAWLTYMVGRTPQTVITSRCEFLRVAVADVFPRVFHCLDLRNIVDMGFSKLVGFEEFDAIRKAFNRAVYHSSSVDEFEAVWEEMVQRHGLMSLEWLKALYEDRKRWAPVYLKEVFMAGMFPVKENELLISPFEGCLSPNTSLQEFLGSYVRTVTEIEQRESLFNSESNNSSPVLKSRFYFELQISKLYTNDVFKRFQNEIEGMSSCLSIRQASIDGSLATYIVKEDVQIVENRRETKDFEVTYNTSDSEILCSCGLFNFTGYLCRHALSVTNHLGLKEIPPQYILERWRKDVKRNYVFDYGCKGIDVSNPLHRYDNLYKCVVKVVEEGRKSHDHYKLALESLDEILKRVCIQEDTTGN